MQGEISKLKEENRRLERLAYIDWLTGISNRGHVQEQVDHLLERQAVGVLFVIDVDRFKQVNDRYGHITGDQLLQELARRLRAIVFPSDILGRVGGDEFVVFMPIHQKESFVEERCAQIRERLRSIEVGSQVFSLSVTVAGALARPGDRYQALFDRADQVLMEKKRTRRQKVMPTSGIRTGISVDMNRIREELSEQLALPGAYCQDYDTFQSIYRFMERRLRRVNVPVCILLFTLTDGSGGFPGLGRREAQMEALRESIQGSLRAGDVFTQYTSCQFLVMVPDAVPAQAETIAERVRTAFTGRTAGEDMGELLHHCYPMEGIDGQP